MKTPHILILTITSFSSSILALFFPEDLNREGSVLIIIFEAFLLLVGSGVFFLSNRVIKGLFIKNICFAVISICLATISLANFPCQNFCPSDFIAKSTNILKNYDKITLNSYKDSYHSPDVIMNNAVLYKFKLPANLYVIEYLDINRRDSKPETLDSYPVWINDGNVIYDRQTLSYRKGNNHFLFTDTINDKRITFMIGTKGLNEVEAFYSGGGSEIIDGVATRNSGVVDQDGIRVIVSKNNPELEINRSYGRLMNLILYAKK